MTIKADIMTLYDEYKNIYENFQLLGNFLIKKLSKCEIEETNDKSFDYLIERVKDIDAVPHINRYNTPPETKPNLIIDGSLADFNVSLAERVRYYENLLAYNLILKGVSRYEVNACTSLAELINLIDKIKIRKHSNLVLTSTMSNQKEYSLNIESSGITQEGDDLDIAISIVDENGTIVKGAGRTINIYKEEETPEPYGLNIEGNNIVQQGDTTNLSISMIDEEGNIIKEAGRKIRLYKTNNELEGVPYGLIIQGSNIVQQNDTTNLTISIVDRYGNIVEEERTINIYQINDDTEKYMLPDEYFGYSIDIPYTLKDNDDNDITEGYISVECDGETFYTTKAGQPIYFTPKQISEKINGQYKSYKLKIIYGGTDTYSNAEEYAYVIVKPTVIELDVNAINISNDSKYFKHNTIGAENDTWEITVTATCNKKKIETPFTVKIDNHTYNYTTDKNGEKKFTYSFANKNNYHIVFDSTIDESLGIENGSTTYDIAIKYNILQQSSSTYTKYAGTTHTYTLEIHNEETNAIDDTYNGQSIICVDGDNNTTLTIQNGQVQYSKTSLSADIFILKWILNQSNFMASIKTNVQVLSNFILPEQASFFLNNTPEIKYCPLGNTAVNKKVNVIIDKIIQRTEQSQLIVNGVPQYETDTSGDYVLDNDGNKIPIMVSTSYDDYDESTYTCYTNASGVLHRFSSLLSPGRYRITLTSNSDSLNETVYYNYELKSPLMLKLQDYKSTQYAIYDLTIYDVNNKNNVQYDMSHTSSWIISETTVTASNGDVLYVKRQLRLNMDENTAGNNYLNVSLNGYVTNSTFVLFNKLFELKTPSVEVGSSQIQILCHDDDIDSISITGLNALPNKLLDIERIEKINDNNQKEIIFYVSNIDLTSAGTKNFAVTANGVQEQLSLTVTKRDISDYVIANVIFNNTVVSEIETLDVSNSTVNFLINEALYSNLSILYSVQKQNSNKKLQSTFTYTSNSVQRLNLPSNMLSGTYDLFFESNGNSDYLPFTQKVTITVIKHVSDISITEQHTVFKDTNCSIYNSNATGTERITSISCDNTSQQYRTHQHYTNNKYDYDISDILFKKGDYTNTHIAVKTSGIPNGVTLYLLDENSKQLYSPVDANNNLITTRCAITVGEQDIISLPAKFTSNLSSFTPLSAGTYNWNFKFQGDDNYTEAIIPFQVEIRDFTVWESLKSQIYPNESVTYKIKTYADTYYPASNFNFITNVTYNSSTGVITCPNSILDTSIGAHTKVINQAGNCSIDYEVMNPIYIPESFLPASMPYTTSNLNIATQIYSDCTMDYKKSSGAISSWKLYDNGDLICSTNTWTNNSKQVGNNGDCVNGALFPPGTHTITCTTTLNNNIAYTCSRTFKVTTEDCSINLEYVENSNSLVVTYLYNNSIPISNATIQIKDGNGTTVYIGKTNSNGQVMISNLNENIYVAQALDNYTDEVLLTSNTYIALKRIKDISIVDGNLVVQTIMLSDINNTEIVKDISIENNNLLIETIVASNYLDAEDAIADIDMDKYGNIIIR